MIVCSCKGVSCSKIRREVRSGALSANEVQLRCGAGGVCGACRFQVAEIVTSEVVKLVSLKPSCPELVVGGNPATS